VRRPSPARHDDKHKNQIEILSWSWGETGAADVEYGWKVEEGDSAAGKQLKQDSIAIKQTTHAASRPNDRLRNAGPRDGWGAQSPGEAEITLKGSTIKQNAAPARPSDITLKRGTAASAGGVSVAAGDVTGDGTAAESGLPTGKRQHKPVTISMPLDRGSVSVMLKSAWPDCRVGTQYPELELGDDTKAYELQDAIVTGCAAESVSLNYSKVKVRGWDPEKKEE
jgi:type VI protein secretion system component Hcp